MFKKKFFKKKPKPKEDKNQEDKDFENKETKPDVPPSIQRPKPFLPDTPVPTPPVNNISTGRILSKEAIVDLPLQHVSSNRRMEDLDDEDFGYATSDIIYTIKRKDADLEEAFLDSKTFSTYKTDGHNPTISRFFFSPQEDFETLSVDEIRNEIDNASEEVQEDLIKHIIAKILPTFRQNKIVEIFSLLACKSKLVRNLCINELTELIMNADPREFSNRELMTLYGNGTLQLFTLIAETKNTFRIFQSLIQLGIIFNCFIYTRAIEAVDEWIACINDTKNAIESKCKRVMERKDPDVQVFAKTAQCIFDLEKEDLDESFLIGEDVNAFLQDFSREDSNIYIEGLAVLYHTGNLMMRHQSKFKSGVQKFLHLSSFMDGFDDEVGLMKWHHHLLCLFIVRLLQREHTDVKVEVLEKCEDQLLSILNQEKYMTPENISTLNCLLFHYNERIRSAYKKIAQGKGIISSKGVTEDHIQTLLERYGFEFDMSQSVSQLSKTFERRQCSFCNVEASITYMFENFQDELMDDPTYITWEASSNIPITKMLHKENMENELEVLKQIESKDIHRNVARLLAFNQSLPKFYIKERLPGDNLQKRLLEARDKGKIIPTDDLINVIVQAVQAVIYIHRHGCLIRDITTASYDCTLTENGFFLKLKNFKMAAKPSDFSSGGIVNGLIDLDFKGVPSRWAAPESLLEGHYSIYSDVWSVNILADEILNYAAWPYSDVSDSDFDDMVTNIVFTNLKPQGFNRPRRVQGLILEGLASVPEQRLKLEALRERLLEISDNISGGESYSSYDAYSRVEGTHAKVYDIPPLTERQIIAKSIFERGIPKSIRRYRELEEDPRTKFASEIAENNSRLEMDTGVKVMEISSEEYYKIDSVDGEGMMKVMEKVSEDFLKFTYSRLKEIDSSKMCVTPWPPTKSVSADGSKQLHYKFPRSTNLLEKVLHRELDLSIGPYIALLYELANHIDSFHSAGWIFRCLRAKNVWILESKKREQTTVVPKFGKYRLIASSESDIHLEQIKVQTSEDTEGIQWLPIEAIKAGLYSKESDVYAFGMITWEVMSAFGQEGVVYDQDEERELTCIPFNYKQSENILQHLIEGYIPEKPIKCPDWFYQEITRPCLLHQKIDRPSMKMILQILKIRLGMSLPKQNLSIEQSGQQGSRMKSKEVDEYEDINDINDSSDYDDVETNLYSSDSDLEESIKTKEKCKSASNTTAPPLEKGRLLPTSQASYYNTGNNDQGAKKTSIPPPPPRSKPRVNKIESFKNGNNTSMLDVAQVSGLEENHQRSIKTSDVNTCKVLPLPKVPLDVHNEDTIVPPSKSKQIFQQNVNEIKSKVKFYSPNETKAIFEDKVPEINKKEKEESMEQIHNLDSLRRRPPISKAHKYYKTAPNLPSPPSQPSNHQPDSKNSSTTGKGDLLDPRDSVNFSTDFDMSVTDFPQRRVRDTYKGSDYYGTITENTGNGTDTSIMNVAEVSDLSENHQKLIETSDVNTYTFRNRRYIENPEDIEKSSDIYEFPGPVDCTIKNVMETERSLDLSEKNSKRRKPKPPPKPKQKVKNMPVWREEMKQKTKCDAKNEKERVVCEAEANTEPIYVNEAFPDTKPAVPPRKPLKKLIN